ncbi:sulfite exporter TauE/SafE family protein [Paenibacillus chungangensis]|uniref:Sulfite exporter TauE/SafE family protein n=1 Tax=Paenibacillus chungangensis TaxID=696535 RepID=A0ABW3HQN9_9BACL
MSGLHSVGLILLTGLLSAPHCIGMCGGIVASVTLQSPVSATESSLLYNSGRLLSYSMFGAVLGAAGSFVNVAGGFAGVKGIASILGGCFVLLWLWRRFQLPFMHRLSSLLHNRLVNRAQQVSTSRGSRRAQVLAAGVAFGFLPCGLTYAMGMNAAASGSVLGGALIMLLFGAATFPALAFAAAVAALTDKRWRRWVRRVGTICACIVGVQSILRGLAVNGLIPSLTPWLW